MSNYSTIENLSEEEILELYEGVLEGNQLLSKEWDCYAYCVCSNGTSGEGHIYNADINYVTGRTDYNAQYGNTTARACNTNGLGVGYNGYKPCGTTTLYSVYWKRCV